MLGRVGIAALLAVLAWPVLAQPPHHRPPHMDGRGSEFFEEVMMARLSRELELSTEQTVLMVRSFTEHRDKVRELNDEQQDKLEQLDEKIESGADDAQIERLLDEVIPLEKAMVDARESLFESMSEGLDAKQRAKLYVFLNRFERDMRRLVGEARERAGRHGPRNPPGDPLGLGPGGRRGPGPDHGRDEGRPGPPPRNDERGIEGPGDRPPPPHERQGEFRGPGQRGGPPHGDRPHGGPHGGPRDGQRPPRGDRPPPQERRDSNKVESLGYTF